MKFKVETIESREYEFIYPKIIVNREDGFPHPGFLLWSQYQEEMHFQTNLNTLKSQAYDICIFLSWLEVHGISIEQRLSKGNDILSSIELSRLIETLRLDVNRKSKVKPSTYNRRVISITKYLEFHLMRANRRLKRLSFSDKAIQQLKHSISKESLIKLHSTPTKRLSKDALTMFLESASPNSPKNPFSNEHVKYRNYCMVLIMVECWLRRAELSLLEISDVDLGHQPTITVRAPKKETSYSRKDGASIKTYGRVIPISSSLACLISEYRQNHRFKFIKKNKRSTALFPSMKDGKRISTSTVNMVINKVAEQIKTIKISPHSLRVTGASEFKKNLTQLNKNNLQLLPLHDIMTYMGGWSKKSSMPNHYTREITIEIIENFLGSNHE